MTARHDVCFNGGMSNSEPTVPARLVPTALVASQIAARAPKHPGTYVSMAQIPWPLILKLRETLDEAGINWRNIDPAKHGRKPS